MRSQIRSVLHATLAVAFLSCTDNSITGPDFDSVHNRASVVTAPAVVISQVYGGGGNAGGQYKNDFVELFNPGSSPVSLSGWSVQYNSSTSTTGSWLTTTLSGSIAAGGYYLVRLGSQGFVSPATDTIGASIPVFDRAGTTNMSAASGKLLVASQTTAFNVQCPAGATVIDRIGYGSSNCGTAAQWVANSAGLSNTTALFRKVSGCTYSGDPSADFATAAPSPRNSASPLNPCNAGAAIDHIAITAPTTVWLTTGGTYTFDVKAFDAANAPVGGVVFGWSSSNNTIATVNSAGVVTVDGVLGPVTITATAGGKTATATVNVVAVDHIAVSPATASIAQNATQQFSATAFDVANNTIFNVPFTWSSADAAKATVDAAGLATGLTGGTVSITAKSANNVVGTASLTVTAPPPPADIVVSQIFGGGGNSGSTILQDYIELYNHGSTPVDLTGWSVQYASSASTSWVATPLTGTIQPGKYFLVQEAAGASATAVALSNPDVIGTIGLSGTNAKVILVRGTAAQSGACPNGGIITDRVAYGTAGTSNDCVATWGAQLTSNLPSGNTSAQWRNNDGCDNTGIVANDFTILTADPRNSLSPAKACTQPVRAQSGATIAINELLSDPVNSQPSSGQWFEVYNYGSTPVDLQGWTIVSGGSNQPNHTIGSSIVVPAGGYAVLGRSVNRTFNGDAPVDYSYFVGTKTIFLDSKDFLILVDNTNARVDSVAWTTMPHGVSVGVRNIASDNSDANGANWGFSTTTFGQGDFGTPGEGNEPLASAPPAVSTNHITVSGRVATDAPLPVGFEAQIFPSLLNQANVVQTGHTFTWSSLTPSIASVDPVTGVIHSLSAGTAVFHVVADDGTQKNHTLVMEAGTLGNAQYGNNTEFGDPIDNTPADEYVVRRPQFTSSYNQFKGRPNWVAYNLNGSQFQSGTDRCNCFTHDPLLPSGFPHLTTADYTGAGSFAAAGRTPPAGWSYGIDRGHMTRSSDRTTGTIDNANTYYLSNVVPQFADLNQGPWNVMEGDLHAMAATGTKEIYIITGPAGINTTTTPGSNGTVKNEGKIEIPASTWKIAVIMARGQGLANVRSASDVQVITVNMPNVPGVRNEDWHQWETTVTAIEQLTGYNFLAALPDNIEAVVEGRTRAPTSQPGGPYSAVEGSPVAFNGSGSSDPDNDPLNFAWQFGDGGTGTGVTTSHVYADNGSYSAVLTVTDPAGASDASNTPVTITNAAPVVTAGSSFVANAGQGVTVSASFSDAGANDSPWTYTFKWGDGVTTTATTASQGGISSSHTYATAGSYSVTVTVTDKDNGTGSSATSGSVRSAPTAAANGPYTGSEGSAVAMSGAASSDTDGTVASYAWSFGDGTTGTGVSVSHAYGNDGDYTVTLVVTDNDGLSNSVTTSAHVTNVAPTVAAFAGGRLPAGGTYTAPGSFDDPGADAWTATVNYGDGTGVQPLSLTGKTFALSHQYSAAGNFTVTVSVSDGAVSSSGTAAVTVLAAPTAAVNGPYTSNEGSSVSMSGAASSDSDGSVSSYAWSFGDGTTGTGASVSHTYAQDGDYTITLVVTDNDGLSNSISSSAHVANVAPTVAAFDGGRLPAGGTYSASGSFDDPGTDTWTATVNYGDGTGVQPLSLTGKAFALSHQYSVAGNFTVAVSVSDGAASHSATASVTVLAAPTAAVNGPYSSTEGSSVAMSGASSSDTDGTISTYAWNFGDGTSGTGASVLHTYANDGDYTVTLVVTDNDGLSNSVSSSAHVTNVAPILATFAGGRFPAGGTYSAPGSFDDPGADAWTATVNYGDGTGAQPLSLTGKAFTLSHQYSAAGNFTVTVTVSDGTVSSSGTAAVTVLAAPTAVVNGPYTSNEGSSVSMSGAGSSDSDGSIASYAWSFGDGTTGTGASVSHTYAQDGDYTITLVVTDNDGLSNSVSTSAHVTNVAPIVAAFAGGRFPAGGTYSAPGSFDDPGADAWTATVNYGDGTGTQPLAVSGKTFALSHQYSAAGNFTVTVWVSDGAASNSATAAVTVLAAPTAATNGPYTSSEGSPVAMSGAASSDTDGTISSYAWNFGDGSTGTGASVSHTYANDGNYSVTLVVTDNDGLSNSVTSSAHVTNVAPAVAAFGGGRFPSGGTYSASGSFTDPGADAWTASVNYGDGTGAQPLSLSGKNFTLSHQYSVAGNYTVTVSVSDGTGSASASAAVTVLAAPTAAVNGPYSSSEGGSIAMSAAGSSDSDGTISSYAWNFGDGTTGTGASVSHTYLQDGDFTVTLVVTDNDGLTGTTTTTAHATNVAPAIAALGNVIQASGSYTANGSFTDPGADSWSATVNYGDGSGVAPLTLDGKNFSLSHTFAAGHTYTVTVTVTDDDVSTISTHTVRITAPPVANAGGPYSSSEGSSASLSGSASTDIDGTVASYAWSFGDGGTGTGANVSHTYAQDGDYTVTLTVTDNEGFTGATTTTVHVTNVAAAIGTFAGATLLPAETYTATGSFADPGADTWSATVNYGDGSGTSALTLSGKNFSLSHKYNAAGTFTVTVTVNDGGATSTRTQTVVVLTPLQGANSALALLDQLVAQGKITAANAKNTRNSLESAQKRIDQDKANSTAAKAHLDGALKELDKAIANGGISAANAAELRAMIVRLIATP